MLSLKVELKTRSLGPKPNKQTPNACSAWWPKDNVIFTRMDTTATEIRYKYNIFLIINNLNSYKIVM